MDTTTEIELLTSGSKSSAARRLDLERGLVKVRWFGVAFAFFQIYMGVDPPCGPGDLPGAICEPSFLRPMGYALAAGLGAINVVLWLWLRREPEGRALVWTGALVFAFDHLFLIGFVWLYSFTLNTTTWVLLYILPLEGALRYGLSGALISIGVLGVAETLRDIYRLQVWGFPFRFVPGTSFRLGIMTIIGLVAGMMARKLERQTQEVERRAALLSRMAAREAASRKELEMFHKATLAGVSTGEYHESMQNLARTIAEGLSFESLAIGVCEIDANGEHVRLVAGYRYPREAIGRAVRFDEGSCGSVARSGKPALVNAVTSHDGYLEFAPWVQSEMAVPLRFGDRSIGVLIVQDPRKSAFTQEDLDKLARLAVPIGVVIENARILAKEKDSVQRLTELDTMKSDFITITSHELRTPLTSIRGFVQTMLRPGLELSSEELRHYLEVVDRQTEKLQTMIEEVGFISQLEGGKVEFRKTSVDLGQAISSMVSAEFPDHKDRISIDCPPAVSRVVMDEERLKKAVANVIDNALKFSPPNSEVTVEVQQTESEIAVKVSDQGIGIPREEIDRIFDRFHQVGGSMGRMQSGFGLGLYMSKRVVESMGGSIRVQSVPGRGSTFEIRFPAESLIAAAS